jgi:hypothetical protein
MTVGQDAEICHAPAHGGGATAAGAGDGIEHYPAGRRDSPQSRFWWPAASATAAVAYFTASNVSCFYTGAMANVTEAELPSGYGQCQSEVREALTRLATRYAAMPPECEKLCMPPKGAAADPTG